MCYFGVVGVLTTKLLDSLFNQLNHQQWQRFSLVLRLTKSFRNAHHLCSSESTPLSAYVLVAKALWNAIRKIIEDEEFDQILGDGAADEVRNMLLIRFNMHGAETRGNKVGLLDEYHLWCYMVNPYSWEWRNQFKINNLRLVKRNMIKHFVPESTPDYDTVCEELEEEWEVSTISYLFIYKQHYI